MSYLINVWIPGVPAPQGSKVAQPIYRGSKASGTREFTGKVRMAEMSGNLATWRETVSLLVQCAWAGRETLSGPLLLGCAFVLPRFKSTRDGDLPTGSRTGDLSKLIRATEDAITQSAVWADDRFVVGYLGWPLTGKRFAGSDEESGCRIRLARPE